MKNRYAVGLRMTNNKLECIAISDDGTAKCEQLNIAVTFANRSGLGVRAADTISSGM
jgi:hypothetical protein